MINLNKLKYEKCQPHPPPPPRLPSNTHTYTHTFKRTCPYSILPPPFSNFSDSPLRLYVFEIGKAKSATQSVLMLIDKTLNGLFQKNFQVFYFTPENSLSLTLHPSPSVFFHYSVCTIISDCKYPCFW